MSKDLIVKSNKLVDGKYNLSLQQIKFINLLMTKLDKDATTFLKIEIRTSELFKAMGIDRRNGSSFIKNLRGLRQKTVILIDGDNTYAECGFLSYFKIDGNSGLTIIKFEEELKDLLLNLKKNFTKLSLEKILNFDSIYTIRFYELVQKEAAKLEKYKNVKLMNFEIDLQELKEMLVGDFDKNSQKISIPKSYNLSSTKIKLK